MWITPVTREQYDKYDELLALADTNKLQFEVMRTALEALLGHHPELVIEKLYAALYEWDI
jgi:hypothetical protein